MPAYDFSIRNDRLKFALSLLSRRQRQQFHARIKREYGEQAAQELVDDLQALATRKHATRY